MPDLAPNSIPDLDRADYTEELRRRLYDIAVQIIFYESAPIPDYTPDQCELVRLQNDAAVPHGVMLHEV